MDKNIKIAKQLVRLAKSLVAIDEEGDGNFSGIADKPGKYENFTGTIRWMGTVGNVTNATFNLQKSDRFHHGIWWYHDTWNNGIWDNGLWDYGIWKDGTWIDGQWIDGTWEDGTWEDGTWEGGDWKGGNWRGGTWNLGDWWKGKWYDGTQKGGIWEYGYDENGNRHLKNVAMTNGRNKL